MSLYPLDTSKWVIPLSKLVESRIVSIRKAYPRIPLEKSVRTRVILQTNCKDLLSAQKLMHGAILNMENVSAYDTATVDSAINYINYPTGSCGPNSEWIDQIVSFKGSVYALIGNEPGAVYQTNRDLYSFRGLNRGIESDTINCLFSSKNQMYSLGRAGQIYVMDEQTNSWKKFKSNIQNKELKGVHRVHTSTDIFLFFNSTLGSAYVSENLKDWKRYPIFLSPGEPLRKEPIGVQIVGNRVFYSVGNTLFQSDLEFQKTRKNALSVDEDGLYIASLLLDSNRFFVGCQGSGLYYSDNFGASWNRIDKDRKMSPMAIEKAGMDGSILIYSNSPTNGLFLFEHGQIVDAWTSKTHSLIVNRIGSLNQLVYLGSYFGRIYILDLELLD